VTNSKFGEKGHRPWSCTSFSRPRRQQQKVIRHSYRVFHNCWNKAIGLKSRILN